MNFCEILILHRINLLIYSNRKNLTLNLLQNLFQTQNIQILAIFKKMFNKFNQKVKINFPMKFYKITNLLKITKKTLKYKPHRMRLKTPSLLTLLVI